MGPRPLATHTNPPHDNRRPRLLRRHSNALVLGPAPIRTLSFHRVQQPWWLEQYGTLTHGRPNLRYIQYFRFRCYSTHGRVSSRCLALRPNIIILELH
jgi:hypothetical protein